MGEEADKTLNGHQLHSNGNGAHHKHGSAFRVEYLRREIAHQRDKLTSEIDELKLRRELATERGKKIAVVTAGGITGALVLASLINAIMDLTRKDSADGQRQDSRMKTFMHDKVESVKQQATLSGLLSAVATVVMNEARKSAVEYARREMRARLLDKRAGARISHNGDNRYIA